MKKSHVFAVCLAVLCLCLWGCGGKKPDTLELVEKKESLWWLFQEKARGTCPALGRKAWSGR